MLRSLTAAMTRAEFWSRCVRSCNGRQSIRKDHEAGNTGKSDKNAPGIRVLHDSETLVFDVRPPLFSRRQDAYRPPWRALWFDMLITFTMEGRC